ncbi:MAG TPA: hypothetical protein VKC34_10870, partial [Blastocatellia bacterium]|nr:hypothetical protein [Blastocatellia bacterium]
MREGPARVSNHLGERPAGATGITQRDGQEVQQKSYEDHEQSRAGTRLHLQPEELLKVFGRYRSERATRRAGLGANIFRQRSV